MGFGKTTLAKRLEKSLPAVRLTHDELMQKAYGRNPDNFDENCFDTLAKKWQPITADEHLNVIEETNVPV